MIHFVTSTALLSLKDLLGTLEVTSPEYDLIREQHLTNLAIVTHKWDLDANDEAP